MLRRSKNRIRDNLPNVNDNLPKYIRQIVPESVFGKLSRIHSLFSQSRRWNLSTCLQSSNYFLPNLLNEVCDDVEIEPCLQTLQGEAFANRTTTTDDEARLDIRANGLWENRFSKTFFDVKIFNPHARTCPKDFGGAYKMHEQIKKLKYEQRIREVKHGGAGPSASKVIKRVAGKLSDKKEVSYSDIITYIRTKISFALLRSSILCIRGSRSLRRRGIVEASIGTVVEESRLLI